MTKNRPAAFLAVGGSPRHFGLLSHSARRMVPDEVLVQVILEKAATGLYLTKGGRWSAHPEEAFSFDSVMCAVDFALSAGLDGVQPVITHSDADWVFRLPVIYRQPGAKHEQDEPEHAWSSR